MKLSTERYQHGDLPVVWITRLPGGGMWITQSDYSILLPGRKEPLIIPLGFEPKSGSVNPKQPMCSPDASFGSQCCFCSSDPKA